MALEVDGKNIELTPTGFLLNAEDWTEHVAEALAGRESIQLTQRHWDVITYLRDQYFNHAGNQPNTRTIVKDMQEVWSDEKVSANSLYQLFPQDPSKQAGRIAGLPESRRKGGY
jgi:tRNA 2-thiouridine synthesizing protein E